MPRVGTSHRAIAFGAILALGAAEAAAPAEPEVRFTTGEVTDARFAGGQRAGELSVKVRVWGDGLAEVEALRFLLADARDDLGTPLLPENTGPSAFNDVRAERLEESLRLRPPAREASFFRIAGHVELFLPGRDPNAVVKVANALSRPGKPLSSPGLRGAGVEITVLPPGGRPREIVALLGRRADFDRIRSVRVLRSDGGKIDLTTVSSWSDGETTRMDLEASRPLPADASLVFTILTAKTTVVVPFEIRDIPLP